MSGDTLEDAFARLNTKVSAGANGTTLFGSDIAACTNFAIEANTAGRADLSIALLEPLSALSPDNPRVWQMLGLAYREEQRMAEAVVALERAARLGPQDRTIALGLAQTSLELGLPAAEQFKRLRAAAQDDGELALSAACALTAEGRGAVADAILDKLVAAKPDWLRGQDTLATTRWIAGDRETFDRRYARAVESRPQDLALRLGWFRAVSQVGLRAKAVEILSEGRRLLGDRIEFDAGEAHAATEQGEDERAEALFVRSAALGDPGTQVSHIRHCLRTGRIEQAEAIAGPLAQGVASATAWPYLSLIWRLRGDARAGWLDGDPPYVKVFDLPLSSEAMKRLAEGLRRLHLARQHPPEQSLRGGTQTEGHLFFRLEPEIAQVRAAIIEAVRDYVAALPPFDAGHPLLGTPRNHLLFAGSWSVRLAAQGFHVVHTHPLGWISSAFYVSLPAVDAMGPAPAGWLELGAPPPDLRLDLPAYATVEPKPGRLVLFPSTMWHGTVPFNDGERLTIAFDVARPRR